MLGRKEIVKTVIIVFTVILLLPCLVSAGEQWSKKIDGKGRFKNVLEHEAVLDKETGLVWEKSPSTSTDTWTNAISHCADLEVGGRKGWHLPTVEQLASLVDTSVGGDPKLPSGHKFLNVLSSGYWSATTYAGNTANAWYVTFYDGSVSNASKSNVTHAWCVRGGQSHDAY